MVGTTLALDRDEININGTDLPSTPQGLQKIQIMSSFLVLPCTHQWSQPLGVLNIQVHTSFTVVCTKMLPSMDQLLPLGALRTQILTSFAAIGKKSSLTQVDGL